MSVITGLLNELWSIRVKVNAVQNRIDESADGQELKGLQGQADSLEKVIKSKGKYCSDTVVGDALQLVRSDRTAWNSDALKALADRHGITADELEACKDTSKVWSIRKVGGR